ncbi:MAG: xanthine dehydrogenase accessory factor [Saprospiraceae bacterium]|jgi:xanthine dehydrogenase accessory factor
MPVWNFILSHLQGKIKLALLYVIASEGSSPGRKGFVMAVTETGIFEGTIGGGIMEVKLIELAKQHIKKGDQTTLIKKQYHDKSHPRNQSGLICSGEQTVALIPLDEKDIPTITFIKERTESLTLLIDAKNGLRIKPKEKEEKAIIKVASEFEYEIVLPKPKTIHIFGAGHVGLALARQMSLLGYRIIQYDDRPELYALQKEQITWSLKIIDYGNVQNEIETDSIDAVAIVSSSYRSDKIILKQLYKKSLAYIGMMGSDQKIVTLKKELATEGITEKELAHVFAPIGINMYSKTAEEIAVSIAGQVIFETNKGLPTGRGY